MELIIPLIGIVGVAYFLRFKKGTVKSMSSTVNTIENVSTTTQVAKATPTNTLATGVVFVAGLSPNDAAYKSLNDYITKFYGDRIPKGHPLLVTDWRQNLPPLIMAKFGASRPIVYVGFSLGGGELKNQGARIVNTIKKAVLIDPVDKNNAQKINNVGLTLPNNVQSAVCFYRGAKEWPFSTFIKNIKPGYSNIRYVPVTSDPHGEKVWNANTIHEVVAGL